MGGEPGNLAYVFADIFDAADRLVPDAAAPLSFSVQGAARLLRAGSSNPFGVESFQDSKTRTYHGTALVILAPTKFRGEATLHASGAGLVGDRLTIRIG